RSVARLRYARKAAGGRVPRPWTAASVPSVRGVARPPTGAWTDRDRTARFPSREAPDSRSVHTDPQALLLPDCEKKCPAPQAAACPHMGVGVLSPNPISAGGVGSVNGRTAQ